MRIHLNEVELHSAVRNFVTESGLDLSGKDVTVQLTAGRGANGHYAEILIGEETTIAEAEAIDQAPDLIEPIENQAALLFDTDDGPSQAEAA